MISRDLELWGASIVNMLRQRFEEELSFHTDFCTIIIIIISVLAEQPDLVEDVPKGLQSYWLFELPT